MKYKGREKQYKQEWQQEHMYEHITDSQWYRIKRKVLILQIYSKHTMRCAKCGISDIDVLTIDHIDNGGYKHRREIGSDFYAWLIKNKFPTGFQVLCLNCNWKKRVETLPIYNKNLRN